MIRVHHLNASRSQRILWFLEELDIPYEVIFPRRDSRMLRAPAALQAVHALGKSPVLEDGHQVFAESGVILEYLVSKWGGRFAPSPEHENYWRYRYWIHYAEGSLMGQLLLKLVADKLGLLAFPIRRMGREQLKLHLDFVEGEAGRSRWIAGDQLTAADIMMSYPLEAAAERAGLGPSRPRTWRLLQQIRERPAYRRALARGGAAESS